MKDSYIKNQHRRRELEREISARLIPVRDIDLICEDCQAAVGSWCVHFDGHRSLPNHASRMRAVRAINVAAREAIVRDLEREGWQP